MKRHVFVPLTPPLDRWVSVEDGTVRDLDGNELGDVEKYPDGWRYYAAGSRGPTWYPTQSAALAALLADPSCPTPGPNRYDRPCREDDMFTSTVYFEHCGECGALCALLQPNPDPDEYVLVCDLCDPCGAAERVS